MTQCEYQLHLRLAGEFQASPADQERMDDGERRSCSSHVPRHPVLRGQFWFEVADPLHHLPLAILVCTLFTNYVGHIPSVTRACCTCYHLPHTLLPSGGGRSLVVAGLRGWGASRGPWVVKHFSERIAEAQALWLPGFQCGSLCS